MGMIIWYFKNNFNTTESSFKIGTEKKVKDLQKSPQHSLGLYAMDYNSDDITHVPSLDKN